MDDGAVSVTAMILAAGRGTRLGPLGRRVPKILLEIGGEPLLARHLRYLEHEGVERVVVNAHHLAEQVRDFVSAYEGCLELLLVVEPELRGTAGSVRSALPHLGLDPFIVLYGDVLVDEPLEPLLAAHRNRKAAATLAVYSAPSTVGKGVVEVDPNGRAIAFREKRQESAGLVNAGLYVLEASFVSRFPDRIPLDFGEDVLPLAVSRGEPVFAYPLVSPVLDVGTPETLALARDASQNTSATSSLATRTERAPHMNGSADISVVICAYTEERWRELVSAVESVRSQSVRPVEIIVVSDHNPALLERVHRELPDVVGVANREAKGLGGARNSGVTASSGSVIAFLDDDAVASPGWLSAFQAAYEDDLVVGVGGSIEPIWSDGRPAWFPDEFGWVVGCTYRGMPKSPADVRNLIGCNMSYRREAFVTVGGFRLGYGCDETEFCIRLQGHWPDRVLRYVPAAKVFHQVPASRARWRHFRSRCYFEGGSKAVVSWLVGRRQGLASERAYTRRVLPAGFGRAVRDAVVHRDLSGLARAGAIVAGLGFTTAGYLRGKLSVVEAAERRGWYDGPARQLFDESSPVASRSQKQGDTRA